METAAGDQKTSANGDKDLEDGSSCDKTTGKSDGEHTDGNYLHRVDEETVDLGTNNKDQDDKLLAKFYKLECEECQIKPLFESFDAFVEHYHSEHERDGELKCCGLSLKGRQNLFEHMKEHKPRHSCSECGKTFKKKSLHSRHVKQHSAKMETDAFSCSHCSKQFSSKYGLANHTNLHLPEAERPYHCRHCGKGFGAKFALAKHERTHLPDAERLSYVCDICGKRFAYASTLEGHQKHVHNDARPFVCHVCAKTFPIKGALTYHLTTHQVQDKVECTDCGIWLKNAKILRIHKKCHQGVIYTCPHCDKVSSTRNNLRMHMKRHSDERPHPCPLCTSAFKTLRDLRTHGVQHTGQKPYCCPYCPKKFASPSNFYAHRKTKHHTASQQTASAEDQPYRSEAVS